MQKNKRLGKKALLSETVQIDHSLLLIVILVVVDVVVRIQHIPFSSWLQLIAYRLQKGQS